MTVSEMKSMTNQQLLKDLGFSGKKLKKVKKQKAQLFCEFSRRWNQKPQKLKKVFHAPEEIYEYFRFRLCDEKQEHLYAIFLDCRHQFMSEHLISKGTTDRTCFEPRDLFRLAIQEAATYVIAAHNHPSGVASPSQADIDVTRRMVEVGKIVGIDVIDHIIVGDDEFFSMKGCNMF